MNMKNIIKYTLSFLAMSAMLLSCAKEDEHQPGEPEQDGCYGVYFPAQESKLTLDHWCILEPLHRISTIRILGRSTKSSTIRRTVCRHPSK